MYYDSHIHSTHSSDGRSSLEDYTAPADNGSLAGIGFAEHLDLMPECGSYGWLDYEAYTSQILMLRDRGYKFFAGCEVDYNKKAEKDIIEHLAKHEYDFVMCSVHMIEGLSISNNIYIPSLSDFNALLAIVEKYYRELKLSIEVDVFDVIGHIGVFKRYLQKDIIEQESLRKLISDVENEIAYLCAKSEKILEVNSSGLFSPLGSTLPDRAFIKSFYDYGGRNVCASSDAHSVSDAGKGLEEVYLILRETGFKYITLPWDRNNPVLV